MKKQMYKRGMAGLAMLIALTFGVQIVSANTVEFAHVFVPDKANGATYDRTRYEQTWGSLTAAYPRDIPGYGIDQNITDGRIVYNGNRYRMPFLKGYDHVVGIAGHLTDGLDRVEIVVNGNVVRTIRKSALIYSGATTRDNPDSRNPERKGLVVLKVLKADLPDLNDDFQIRIRFAVEVAGFDKLDCKAVHGSAQIKSIRWTDNNGAELPDIFQTNSGRRVFKTDCGGGSHSYNLRLICFKAPASVQAGDGIKKEILGREITQLVKTEGRVMTDTIDVKFKATYVSAANSEYGEKPEKFIRLCDAEVGNIPGGWGTYIYMEIIDNLQGFTDVLPYQTNLKDLDLCGPGGGTTTGQVIRIGTSTTPPPVGQPDITVTIENAFTSGVTFNAADAAKYNFCQNLPDEQQTRQTIILPLTIKIKNTGAVDIRTPFTVAINGNGNANFYDDRVETVPTLNANETYQIIIDRRQRVVCGRKSGTNCVRCAENFGGLRQWNDKGVKVTVDNGGVITESNETNNVVNVP